MAPSAWVRSVYMCTLPAAFAIALPDHHPGLLIPLSALGCRVHWVDSLRSGMDHVPGIGPHRAGMVTPGVGSPHSTQPNAVRFDSTSDTMSRHCQKKLRCPVQPCLDAIKHCVHFRFGRFGDELLFGAQTCIVCTFWLKTKMDL